MKNKLFVTATIALALATTAVFISCSNEDDNLSVDNGILLLSTQMDAPATRVTSENTWAGNELVRVVINAAPTISTFKVATDGILTPVSPLYWNDYSAAGIAVHAWYPGGYRYPTNQNGGIQSADFIFAKQVTGITKDNFSDAAKQLKFEHKTAKVTVTLSAGAGVSVPAVSGASVRYWGYTSVSVVDSTGSNRTGDLIGRTDSFGKITPNGKVALLLPKTYTGENLIEVEVVEGVSSKFYYYKPSSLTLEAGKFYTFNITVNPTGLTVSSTIQDWTNATPTPIQGDATL